MLGIDAVSNFIFKMVSYVLFRDKKGFSLTNGKHSIFSSSLDLLVDALNQPYIYGHIYGSIEVPSSFDDDRVPLNNEEREKFLTTYTSQISS